MLISHISDIHLGYAQYNLQEREEDLYEVFEESIEKSIKEHVRAIILAGDIFHNPKPNGAPILRLARELKKLRDRSIPVLFILGEHDISRSNDVPLPYLFHNLGLARRLKADSPIEMEGVLIYGFNKERRSNVENGLLKPFRILESRIKNDDQRYSIENKKPRKMLVLHQGLNDFNKFAGEISSSDLPSGFDYYAMGHYHDHIEKRFPNIGNGLVAYPGSIDLGHSEPISNVEKGFLIVDVSESSASINTHWIKLERRRPQLSFRIDYSDLSTFLNSILEESSGYSKKPIIDLQIVGTDIDQKILSRTLMPLENTTLHYNWNLLDTESSKSSSYSYDRDKEFDMDIEMSKLIQKTLDSKPLTDLSLDLIRAFNDDYSQNYNDVLDRSNKEEIAKMLWKFYESNRFLYDTQKIDANSSTQSKKNEDE
ncbi:metallophosphoesterase family protein [Candidatus Nitrosocosmicus franklandus]|uniref:Exonuclease subunit SbcD n=1 Tax=Candidatus Nitrosocosmicus franklandianus TaxID=1798806 RepID=A0A484IAL7_9ARCH|nr:DNA repair exonuclease [Candidatus Nitrosocosmicus franklandus]VFJ13257.1 Exonuclease subunit SbcD [Candidatus Nitrosocosmicus franklandus]